MLVACAACCLATASVAVANQRQPVPFNPVAPLDSGLSRLLFGASYPSVQGGAVEVKHPVMTLVTPDGAHLVVSSFMTSQVIFVPLRTQAQVASPSGSHKGGALTDEDFGAPRVFASGGAYCPPIPEAGRGAVEGGDFDSPREAAALMAPAGPCAMLDGPWGLATRGDVLYVASFASDQILKFNWTSAAGEYLGFLGSGEELDCPEGITFGPDGLLYVASFLNDVVVRYDVDKGVFRGAFAAEGLFGPEDLVFNAGGDLLVSSHWSNSVERFDPRGRRLEPFAQGHGGGSGSDAPTTNSGDNSGHGDSDIGSDAARASAEEKSGVDPRAAVQARWAATLEDMPREDEAGLYGPVGITSGPHDDIYVSSYMSNTIVRYDGETGDRRGVYARGGGVKGPAGLCFDAAHRLYTSSYDNHKVVLFTRTTTNGDAWEDDDDFGDVDDDAGGSLPMWASQRVPI